MYIPLREPVAETVLQGSELKLDHLRVLEIYTASGQGEGFYQGVPTHFIRLAGCSVGCTFCDTKYSWRSTSRSSTRDLSVEQIIAKLFEIEESVKSVKHVVITGGEPLEHPLPALFTLVRKLSLYNYQITIETSGVVDPFLSAAEKMDWFQYPVLWSLAPKLPSAGARVMCHDIAKWITCAHGMGRNQLQVKFVIGTDIEQDLKDTIRILQLSRYFGAKPVETPIWVFFQPMTPATLYDHELTQFILEHQRKVQEALLEKGRQEDLNDLARAGYLLAVRPQQHVLMYGHKRLV